MEPTVFFCSQLPDKDFLTRQIERVKKYRLEADATPMWEFKARTPSSPFHRFGKHYHNLPSA